MRKSLEHPAGTVHHVWFDSAALAANMLGDPSRRRVDVYVPHGHDGRGLPLLVDVVGFTAGGPAHTNWKNFGENVPERLDRLIGSGAMKPCVAAFPDCFTRLGGNQYVNSIAMGHWADFLIEDCVPTIERQFQCGGAGRRGIFGKSSGGYGAMVHALLSPGFWAAAASHSGDMAHELCHLPEFPGVLRALAKHNGSIENWLKAFYDKPKTADSDVHTLMMFAMCASYDPDPTAYWGVRLPVDAHTCEIIPERWANFMKWDPLTIAAERAEGLKKLKLLYLDCGDIDQYNLVYGARRMTRLLTARGVPHVYEEFADNHSSVDYRMDISLPLMSAALSA